MVEKEKVKIAYATRPVEVTDGEGKTVITYEKYHPVTTGNAVVVGGKTLKNKFGEYYTKEEIDAMDFGGGYEAPDGGIPKTDLSNDVQTSLGKADTALQEHQDISGKENTSNKVSSWSSTTTDTHYPSEKLVKTALDAKQNTINASNKLAASNVSGLATVATSGSFNDLSNKPTTLDGYGITDALFNLGTGTAIDSGADLDTYTTPGTYRAARNTIASTLLNAPTTLAFKMVVTTTYTTTAFMQIIFVYNSPKIYARSYYNSWGDWKLLAWDGAAQPANGGNSDTVNNHSVNADVPSDAKFTDTTYSNATTSKAGLMSSTDKSHVDSMWTMLDTNENASAIDNWNEVKTFLANIDPSDKTLVGMFNAKQDTISSTNKLDASLVDNMPWVVNLANSTSINLDDLQAGVYYLGSRVVYQNDGTTSVLTSGSYSYLICYNYANSNIRIQRIITHRKKEYIRSRTSTGWGDWTECTPYVKPNGGIQESDLSNDVQTSLGKADTAVQPSAISDMETKTHAAATYQPKGSYLTSHQDISGKVDKESGKGLSTNDFTDDFKTKLDGIGKSRSTSKSVKLATISSTTDRFRANFLVFVQGIYTNNNTPCLYDVSISKRSGSYPCKVSVKLLHGDYTSTARISCDYAVVDGVYTCNIYLKRTSTATGYYSVTNLYDNSSITFPFTAIENDDEVITNSIDHLNNTDQTNLVFTFLDESYVKPSTGIPSSDIASGVIPTTLPANGGNADTVDNYHFVVGSSAGTAANTIYFVV